MGFELIGVWLIEKLHQIPLCSSLIKALMILSRR